MPRLTPVTLLIMCVLAPVAQAQIYIYRQPGGGRMVTDHPLPPGDKGYRLLTKRDTLHDAGYILARRQPPDSTAADYLAYIRAASHRYGIDPDLVEAVIHVESGFDPSAVSNRGASGLMQLMWGTARHYDINDRFNPRENIDAGVHHLSDLMKRFNGRLPLVLAAWNAGTGAVEHYKGVPPFPETRHFVAKVLKYQKQLQELYSSR